MQGAGHMHSHEAAGHDPEGQWSGDKRHRMRRSLSSHCSVSDLKKSCGTVKDAKGRSLPRTLSGITE